MRLHASIVRWSVGSSAVAGGVALWTLWGIREATTLLCWLGALALVLSVRVWCGRLEQPEVSAGLRRLLISHRLSFALHGMVWGTAGLIFLPGLAWPEFEVLSFVLVAMCVGSLISTPFDVRAALAFTLPTLAPLVWTWWVRSESGLGTLGAALALLLITLLVSATRARAILQETVKLRLMGQAQVAQARELSVQSDRDRQELANKNSLLTALMDSSEQGFLLSDAEGICTDLNPAMCELLGRTRDSVLGHSVFSFFDGADLEVLREIRATRGQGTPRGREVNITRPDGRRVHCHVNATPIFDSNARVQGVVGVWTDLTARREAELSLRISEVALNSISEMVSVVDENLRYRMVNDAWIRFTGRSRESVLGRTTREIFASTSSDERRRLLRECLEEQKTGAVRDGIGVHSGASDYVETSFYPYADDSLGVRSAVIVTRDIGVEHRALRQAQESEAEYRMLLDSFPGYIGAVDQNYVYTYVNQALVRALGQPREAIVGRHVRDVLGEQSFEQSQRQTALALEGLPVVREAYYPATADRDALVIEVTQIAGPQRTDGSQTIYGFGIDITERKRQESDLRIAAVSFESQDAMFITDARGAILRVNQAFTRDTGYSMAELMGRSPRHLISSRHSPDFIRQIRRGVRESGTWKGEFWSHRKDGDAYPTWLTVTAVKDSAGRVTHLVGLQMDLSQNKKDEQRIESLVFFDPMTQLANRTLLMHQLRQALTASARDGVRGAVLLTDLDHFKTLNDTMGHDMGDMLLQQVAIRIGQEVGEVVSVARLGGDEFAVVVTGLRDDAQEAARQVRDIGERLLLALRRGFMLGDVEHFCSASIGITLYRGEDCPAEELLRQADLAMYRSKENGRDMLTFFDPNMQSVIIERASMEARIRKGMAEQQFTLHYQPQLSADQRVSGAEALIRWNHPELGMVSPVKFIGVAEESGLIIPLGHWVLETACWQLAQWAQSPALAGLTLAVNVSAHQLHSEDFVEQVVRVLELTGANPKRLKLELTESLLVNNIEGAIRKMTMLRALGVSFSLDDFGTGYSSLAYLTRLPLDQLKIDRSFVQDIELRDEAVAICSATISLAHTLKLRVVAEGVETEAQRYVLSTVHRCDLIQGYLYSRPLPVAEFEAFVQRH